MRLTVFADAVKRGDKLSVGDVGDAITEQAYVPSQEMKEYRWIEVVGKHVFDNGFTDLTVQLPDGEKLQFDIPSGTRVAIRRAERNGRK